MLLGGALWAALSAGPAVAEPGAPAPAVADPDVVRRLTERVDHQDEEIHQLKAMLLQKGNAPTAAPLATDDVKQRLDAHDAEIKKIKTEIVDSAAAETATIFPSLQFHGFADINYHAGTQKADKNAFALGELDLFFTSQLAPDLGLLSETVIAADDHNHFGIDIERLVLQYHPSVYFNVDVGRYHTAIGYYNTAYHHGAWFQTAVGRPQYLSYEDNGGIIPVHNIGASFHGAIPSGKLGLNYYVEVGNGRQYQPPGSDRNAVANISEDNAYKAVNLALTARPEGLPGLQFGAGVYHDTLSPAGVPRTDEIMIHGHLVYKNADWEFLSEGLAIHHSPRGMSDTWSEAGFVQVARKFGKVTPYARFSYFNAADADPIYQLIAQAGRHYGPAVGIRYDFSTFAALKLQYDYVVNHGTSVDPGPTFSPIPAGSFSRVTVQMSFTF